MVQTRIGEVNVPLIDGAKSLREFTELPYIEKKKSFVNLLNTKVDELFMEEEEDDEELYKNKKRLL